MKITVTCDGPHGLFTAAIDTPDVLEKQWEPLKTSDSILICLAAHEHLPHSEHVATVVTLRRDAAKVLSEALVKQLMKQMAMLDTHNGYALGERA